MATEAPGPADRESFLAAIERHRRASWRVTVACAVGFVVLAIVVAILMSPLLFGLVALAVDIVNLFVPAPDLMGALGRSLSDVFDAPQVPVATAIRTGAVAALPGVALMGLATFGLRRVWAHSPLFDGGDLPGRAPNRTVLAEERLANVVEEMAIAAGIPAPRVLIVEGGANAAACGRDESHVTLLVGEGLLDDVDREQMEGFAAHLVGSIADGDMTIGLRVTTTLALFALVSRLSLSLNDRGQFRKNLTLWRVFVTPTSARTAALLAALSQAIPDATESSTSRLTPPGGSNLTWREWLLMPLMGPLWLAGFLSGIVTQFYLEPLIALAWRQRKYMADATAVELTRDPDALAKALATLDTRPAGLLPWTAHLAVGADPRGGDGPFGTSFVPIFPSVERRQAALRKMGAHLAAQTRPRRMPAAVAAILVLLGAVVLGLMSVVVVLLTGLSAAMSGLFTIMPMALLHVLLRWVARW